MKPIECRLPQEFDKSFIVFEQKGTFFPYPWHYHPEYELVLITKSTGRRMVGDHIGYFQEGDLVFMGPVLPHVWVNDPEYVTGQGKSTAEAIVIQFVEGFLGDFFINIPELEQFTKTLKKSKRGIAIRGKAKERINNLMKKMLFQNGLQRLASLFTIFDILATCSEYEILANPTYELQGESTNCSERFNKITEYIMHWGIETFFKWIKQHLKIQAFWGQSENAVKTQIWIAISAYLVIIIANQQLKLKYTLYEILQLISLAPFDPTPIKQLFENAEYQDVKELKDIQLKLF